MGTEKRERQKANRAARLEAERTAEARARRNQTIRNVVIVGVVIVALMVLASVLSGCSSSSDATADVKTGNGSGDAPTTTVPSAQPTYGTGECPPEDGAKSPKIDFEAAPKKCIDQSKSYTAKVETSEGTVTLALDTERTPITTNNFVVLARYGYFDDTDLFRTEAPSGIIQGGSPHTQANTDQGPGYTIPDEGTPFSADDYGPGTIAMANTGQPNSGGAQFFFLANEGGRYLADPSLGPSAGSYVAFGKVTAGMDVLDKIAKLDDGNQKPSKKVTITQVTIRPS